MALQSPYRDSILGREAFVLALLFLSASPEMSRRRKGYPVHGPLKHVNTHTHTHTHTHSVLRRERGRRSTPVLPFCVKYPCLTKAGKGWEGTWRDVNDI